MAKQVETTINRWDGGIVNDPRDTRENTCRMVTNFDILSNPHKLTPYRSSESGGSASTSLIQNFCVDTATDTLWGYGRQAALAKAKVYKNTDFTAPSWADVANSESATINPNYNLFVYYAAGGTGTYTGRIFGAENGTHIWSFDPSLAAAWDDEGENLTYTRVAQGLVHSKDDILYIPYDNKIAKKNGSAAFNFTALTLPSYLYITSICEYGNYLAIATAPLSGIGHSKVFLWDRDSTVTTLSENIDWGEERLNILEEIDSYLVGISYSQASVTGRLKDRLIFKYWAGSGTTKEIEVLQPTTGLTSYIAKQKANNKLYFLASATFNGTVREGIWSIGRNNVGEFAIVHERTPNNNTASAGLYNFFLYGDYMFIAFLNGSTHTLSKTNDQSVYSHNSIWQSKKFNTGGSFVKKNLIGLSITHEPLPAGSSITVGYKTDAQTSYTTILTSDTDDAISASCAGLQTTSLPKDYKEIEFQLTSTGGAEVTSLSFKEEITDKRPY